MLPAWLGKVRGWSQHRLSLLVGLRLQGCAATAGRPTARGFHRPGVSDPAAGGCRRDPCGPADRRADRPRRRPANFRPCKLGYDPYRKRLWPACGRVAGPIEGSGSVSARRTGGCSRQTRIEKVVAAYHGAFARAVHGQSVEQAKQREKAVHLPAVGAHDRESAVLGLEAPERLGEYVHPGRVHERDFGQIHDNRTGLVLEDRRQDLAQYRRGREVDFPVDTEHRYVRMMLVGREHTHRQGAGRRRRQGVGLLRSGHV